MKNKKNNQGFCKTNIRSTSLFLAALMIAFGSLIPSISKAATATTDATLFFNPSSTSAAVGNDFPLVARVNPGSNTTLGSDAVNAVELDITFDPAKLQLNNITPSSSFGTVFMGPTIDNVAGTASIVVMTPPNPDITTTTDVATFSFHAQAAVSNSSVAFTPASDATVDDVGGTKVVATRTGATATVTVPDTTPPTFSFTYSAPLTPVKNETINITASDAGSGVATTMYGFSSDNICDGSDTITTSFTNGTNFNIGGNHTDYLCVKATDNAGNIAYQLVGQLNTNNTGPTLAEVTAVPAISAISTPSYTFSSSAAGTITYGGGCSSSTTTATTGNNTITFNALSRATSYNCIINVTDTIGNMSTLNSTLFRITYKGDFNLDRTVNISDLSVLAGDYGKTSWAGHSDDINGDGIVNLSDLSMLAADFGKSF